MGNKSYGSAGSGLGSRSAQKKFGANAGIGAMGERQFGEMLKRAGLDSKYTVWYSLSLPSIPGQKDYGTDVDVAISNGDKIILIDVKRWSAKYTYWSIFGKPFQNLSPKIENGKWGLSKNMEMALDRFRKNLPGISVEAAVIFVPTSKAGTTPTVGFLRWPGNIKSYAAADGLIKIQRFLGKTAQPSNPIIMQKVGRLVKK